ncbi:fibronectin type III domain-containing protein [Candidatus Poriferisocius sp.]|uniref:fibronectin type III domain-containing protein n=1 Tax=Candidatus Poriferisocius sp. TaxID=3101276 RepID=UPI003B013611
MGFDFVAASSRCWSGQIPTVRITAPAKCTTSTLNRVTISWEDPDDQYNWRVRRITGLNQFVDTKTFAKGGATTADYTGLQPGTGYEFEVSKRAGSSGEWDDHTPSLHCSTRSSNPRIDQCPNTADTDGTVRWTPNGAAGYRISIQRAPGNPNWIVTNANYYTFTGLAEGITYTVNLQAWNTSGWSTGTTCSLITLPSIPSGTLTTSTSTKHYFTKGTVKGVLYAAGKAISDKGTCTAGMPSTNKLAAIMLSIPIHELNAAFSSTSSPTPMTLSRWDNLGRKIQTHPGVTEDKDKTESLNKRLYSHVTKQDYVRAFWNPGVGLWQLDPWDNSLTLNHAERADTTKGGLVVASYLLNQYCTGINTLKSKLNSIWHGCSKDNVPDRCYNTFTNELYHNANNVDQLKVNSVDAFDEVDGGVRERTCRWATSSTEIACYLYDVELTQGWMDKAELLGADSNFGRTPLSKAFLAFTDPNTRPNADRDTGTRYAVWPKQWPRSSLQTSWPTDVVATDKTIFRAVKQKVEVRCSPGLDPTPERRGQRGHVEIGQDCAEETYKPFGESIENHDFSGSNKFAEGWYDDSVPFRNGGTVADRHSLQVQNCEAGVVFGQAVVYCWWVDV